MQDFKRRMLKAAMHNVTYHQSKIRELKLRLYYASPTYQIKQRRQQLMDMEQKLTYSMERRLKDAQHRLEIYITRLEGLSPLTKLKRGYALVRGEDGRTVQSIRNVKKDDRLIISLVDGDLVSRIEDIKEQIREYGGNDG